jgi:hypothetical protein
VTAAASPRERAWLAFLLITSAILVRLSSVSGADGGGRVAATATMTALCWVAGLLLTHEAMRAFVSAQGAFWATVLVGHATFVHGSGLVLPALPELARFVVAAGLVAVFVRRERTGRAATAWFCGALLLLALTGLDLADGWRWAHAALRLDLETALDVLFSSRRGVLFWSPVLWAGVLGYVWLWPRERPRVRPLLVALAAVALMLLLGAVLREVEPGEDPYRAGGFETALPLLAIGLAGSLAWLHDFATRRPGRVLAGAGALLVVWNVFSMEQYRRRLLPPDDTVSFARMTETNARLLSETVGTPLAWPANWLFAARHGVRPDKYDVVAGKSLPEGSGTGVGTIDFGDDRVDPALVLEGWSGREPCGTGVCRRVLGRARLLAPLPARPAPPGLDVIVRAAGHGTFQLAVNEQPGIAVLLDEPARDRTVHVPADAWRPGVNALVFEAGPGAEVRVDAIVLEPGEARDTPRAAP